MTLESSSSAEEVSQPPRRLEVVSEKIMPDRKPRSTGVGRAAPLDTQLESAVVSPPPQPVPPPPAVAAPMAPSAQMVRDAKVAALFEVVSRILAVRLFMLAAVAGGFSLGWRVTDQWSAVVFLVFTVAVVLPMILLEYRVRK